MYEYLTESGIIVPDTADTRNEVASEWRNALGQDLIIDDETPQGLLINAETIARQEVARNNANIANQINPDLAEGVFLDSIWALTGGGRYKATHTIVQNVELRGVPATRVPEGTILQSGNNQFESISQATLNESGRAFANFQSLALGAIPCPVNTLTQIITPVLGLETTNNPLSGVLGKEEETDQAARLRRRNTLALQGRALPEAIISDLYSLDGVRSLAFRENVSNETAIIDGIEMKPHSIWVCVDGGSDSDIAKSLLNTKSLGAGYNGDVNISVVETVSGQAYEVLFDRPEPVLIYIRVTIKKNNTAIDANLAIRSSIIRYVSGEQEGEQGFVVGNSVSPFELASAVNREHPTLYVKKVEVSTDNVVYSSDTLSIALDEIAITTEGLILVVTE